MNLIYPFRTFSRQRGGRRTAPLPPRSDATAGFGQGLFGAASAHPHLVAHPQGWLGKNRARRCVVVFFPPPSAGVTQHRALAGVFGARKLLEVLRSQVLLPDCLGP